MTSGIYLLEFDDYSYYIGRSGNIENRVRAHINMLKNSTHYNHKLLKKYLSNGIPTNTLILEECNVLNQISREIYWIDIFEATKFGLNITKGGDDFGIGEDNYASKYSNIEITKVFHLLVDNPELTLKEVSDLTEVSYGIVREIAKGAAHPWLQDIYPEKYKVMLSLKGTRVSKNKSLGAYERGIIYPNVISPEGVTYTIENARQFAIQWNLDDGSLNRLLHRKQKTHKGWKLATES